MLALRKVRAEEGGISVDRIELPEPGPGEVRVKVAAAGICGTDLHIYNWRPAYHFIHVPIVMGHEAAGSIDAIGDGVDSSKLGQRVSLESHIPCNACPTCRTGNSHVCGFTRYPGLHLNGGFASHVVVPAQIAIPIGTNISIEAAAMLEPFGIAVHATQIGGGISGKNVLITGCGPIGLMCVLAARALGANRIAATDINAHRLNHALKCGADRVVNVQEENLTAVTKHDTNSQGYEVVIDSSGAVDALRTAGEVVARGGQIRLVGIPNVDVPVNMKQWMNKGVTVIGLHGRRLHEDWITALRLVETRKVDLMPLISHDMGLRESPKGFEEALAGRAIKVLVRPE